MLSIYNIRSFKRASKAFTKLTDAMALSGRKAVQSLRKTLVKWRVEILNYFKSGITNAKTAHTELTLMLTFAYISIYKISQTQQK